MMIEQLNSLGYYSTLLHTYWILGHDLYQGTYKPICRTAESFDKFPNVILDKTQLQRFLGNLNYVANFIPKVRHICKPIFDRLKKNLSPWSDNHTDAVILLKTMVQNLPCLGISNKKKL